MKDKDGRMVPTELVFALEEDRDAMGAWETMPRSHQRDFTRWVDEAEPEERAEKAGE
ncbi:MAG: YdeI/OmpD-associated family protein, partial [Thermoplasmata archaeon]|nr:YdeI/OmpD-associated family protein [Thermoplasmata archaeon]